MVNNNGSQEVARSQKVLTTGQVARACNVAPRTVSKWFDTGQLRGYRIPGSRDRRIPIEQLVRFMKAHGIPLNGLDPGPGRVLLVDGDAERSGLIRKELERAGFGVETADSPFEAGMLVERFSPHFVLLDMEDGRLGATDLAAAIRCEPKLTGTRLVGLTPKGPADGEQGPSIPRGGLDARLDWPFSISELVDLLVGLAR
jgi:excisionase family DNA binding protein